MEAKLLVLLALVAYTAAGPIAESDTCSTTCEPPKKFNYAPQTSYVYDYRVDTTTAMTGASEDSGRLTLQTRAIIDVLSPCEFSLILRGTRLYHSSEAGALKAADNMDDFRSGLELRPLRFSFQDGTVPSVCSQEVEPAWVMNIKKGLLSSFQNSMDDLTVSQNTTETDVAGTCQTEYKSVSNGYYTTSVQKTKDMLSCTGRNSYNTLVQMVAYKVPSEIQSAPIIKTRHQCSQDIEVGGVLKTSSCQETHVFRPFSNGQSGGSTEVKQTLTYVSSSRGVSSNRMSLNNRESLTFDQSAVQPASRQARRLVEQKLGDLCAGSQNDIRPVTPRQFTELVLAMKALDHGDMESIYKLLKTKTLCPENERTLKFFKDALPMTSTSASVKLMTSLMTSEEVTGLEAKAWIASLALVRVPETDMLLDAKLLIDSDKLRDDAILPVSSLVNNYCRGTSACEQKMEVVSVIRSLERVIGYRCEVNDRNFGQVLLALRGLGNAGHASRAVSIINKCLTNPNNPMVIRVSAAEAFRRMPCDAEDSQLWSTYEDASLDSELRIAAYLALMRCPSQATLAKMAESLNTEQNDQVGAFVYSHLTNLRETSDPLKQDVAQAIGSLSLKEFDISPIKYSRNFESSLLINKINAGFGAESSLVWSSETQMPRSMSANLTIDLFGQSINLLDFGGRLDGLQYLVQTMFGRIPDKKAEKFAVSLYGRVFGNEMLFQHSKTAKSPFPEMPSNWIELLIALSQKHDYAFTHSSQFMDATMYAPTCAGLPISVHVNGTATVDLVLSGKMDLRKIGAKPRSLDIDGEIKPSGAVEITGTMLVDAHFTKTGLRMRNLLHSSTSLKGRVQLDRGQLLNVELDTPQDKMDIFSASSEFYILNDNVEKKQEMITDNRKHFQACTGSQVSAITGMKLCGEVSFPNASMKADSPYYPVTGPSSATLTLVKTDSHSSYKLMAKRGESKKSSFAQISFNTPGSRIDRNMMAEIEVNYPKQHIAAAIQTPWNKAKFTGSMLNNKVIKSISGTVEMNDKDVYGLTAEVKVTETKSKIQLNPMVELRRPGTDNIQLVGFVAVQKPLKSMDMDLSLSGLKETPYTLKGSFVNTKKEKSFRGSFSADGKNEYSVLASNVMNIMGKKMTIASLRTLLKVHTPEKQLMAMQGSADYKEGKSIKMDGSLDMHRLLRKPATFKVVMVKTAKKKGIRYDVDANMKSSALSGALDSYLSTKPSGALAGKATVDYTIPRVAKNKITLSGKLNVKNQKSYTRYVLKSNLNLKKDKKPTHNFDLSANLEDKKKKNTAATIELKYGLDRKDKNKRFFVSTSLSRKIFTLKRAIVVFKTEALAPEHGIDVSLNAKHQHTKKMLDSSLGLNYGGKGKDISAGVTLRDKSSKLAKMTGNMNVAWPGSEYTLKSDLTQKTPKQYENVLHFKDASGKRHVISTTYMNKKPMAHDVSTLFRIAGAKPVTVGGSLNMDPKNFESSGEVKVGKKAYGISTSGSFTKAPRASVNIELVHPARKIVLTVDGGKAKGIYDGLIAASWDADQDKSQKISLSGTYMNKRSKKDSSIGGSLTFSSPFESFENIEANAKYGSDEKKHSVDSKFSWGEKKQVSSSMILKKPVSLYNIDMNAEGKTPFNGFSKATLDINHSFDKKMSTLVKATLEDEVAKLAIDADAAPGMYKGNAALKTTSDMVKSLFLNVDHKSNDGRTASKITLTHNGDKYGYDMNMDHSYSGWTMSNVGDLTVLIPRRKISTNWQHKNTDKTIQSTLKSEWAGKRLIIDLDGSHDLFEGNTLTGALKIKSPWKSMHNIHMAVNHKMETGFINSNAVFKKNGKAQASTALKYNRRNNAADCKFELTSPFHADITGHVKANYNKYPMTGSADLQWAKKSRVNVEGSLNAGSWHNADAELKLTSPFKGFRQIAVKATNSKEGDALVSHLIFDHGVQKSIDVETRVDLDGQTKLMRLKLSTPYDQFRSMETGFRVSGHSANFVSAADFEVLPGVGKFQGSMDMKYDDDLQGRLRIDTPFTEYPYFELTTSSQDKGKVRNSVITAEYHPSQMYRFDSTYAFQLPMTFEATINTPYPQFNDLGISIQHDHSPVSISSHAEVRYQPNKKIEGDLSGDLSDSLEGSLMVKTPLQGYEMSRIHARHQGNSHAFATHAEVNFARESVIADATYNGGYTTRGVFTFTSPIRGLENLEVAMNKKGHKNNVRGGIAITLNGEKSSVNFNHRMRPNSLKSGISISTPFSDDFKASVDHNGEATNFNNKMSVNFGRKYDVDTVVSVDYRAPELTSNGMIKYKLGGRRNIVRLSLGKSGYSDDMTVSGTASFNNDDISLNGAWKSLQGYDGSIVLKSPIQNFQTIGLTVSQSGDLDGFQGSFDVNYMDNKHIVGTLTAELASIDRLRLTTQLKTPFENFESTVLSMRNDYDRPTMNIDGQVELTSTIGEFGTGNIIYSKTGGLRNLAVDASSEMNGRKLANLKVTHVMLPKEIHSQMNFNTAATEALRLKFDHMGDLSSSTSKASAQYGRNSLSGEANMKQGYNDIDADASMRFNIRGLGRNSGSISFHKDGDLDNFNTMTTGKLGNNAASISLSKSGRSDDMTVSSSLSLNRDTISIEGTLKNQQALDGSIRIKTPFIDYRNVGMKLTHAGDLTNFASGLSVDYMDNKNVNGDVKLSVDGLRKLRLSTEVNTPFRNMEKTSLKVNHDYDYYYQTVNGGGQFTTSIPELGSGIFEYSKSGSPSNLVVESKALVNNKPVVDIKITNNLQGSDLTSSLKANSPWTPALTMALSHSGDIDNFNNNVKATLGENNVVTSEMSLKTGRDNVDAFGKVAYRTRKYGSNQASVRIEKEGQMDDIKVKTTTQYARNKMIVNGALNTKNGIEGSLSMDTGVRGYKNIGMSFKHSGNLDRFNTEAKMNLMDGEVYSTKIDFYRYMLQRIETTAELRTPIPGYEYAKYEYRHEGQSDSFKCYATLEYGQNKKISYDLNAVTMPNPDFSINIKTPFDKYDDMQISGSFENNWPKLSAKGKLNAGNGNIVSADASLDASKDIMGTVSISTPVRGFTDIGLNFEHAGSPSSFSSNGQLTYMDGKTISGKTTFRLPVMSMKRMNMYLMTELKTPFPGMEFTKFEHKTKNAREFVSTSSLVYGAGQVIKEGITVTYRPNPSFSWSLETPYESMEELKASGSVDMTGPKYELNGMVSAGRAKTITLQAETDISNAINGQLTLKTPFRGFRNVGYTFAHSGTEQKFSTEGKVTYMDDQAISGSINFHRYAWRRLEASAELTTPFSGLESTKAEVGYEDNTNSVTAMAALDKNGLKYNGNLKFTSAPNYDVLITVNTPFYDYKTVRVQGTLDTRAPSYAMTTTLNLGRSNAYSANGKLNMRSMSKADGSLELSTPFDGLRYTKVVYRYDVDYPRADGLVSLSYDNGNKVLSGELKSAIEPAFDAEVTIKTPFYGYETLKGAATFESSYKKYDSSSSLNLGQGQVYSMTSGLDYSDEPMKAFTKISTPYRDFRNVEAVITHEGDLTNFKCTGFFSTPYTKNINAKTDVTYNALSDMSLMASLKSALPDMDDLSLEVRTNQLPGEKKGHVALGWTQGQEIVADGVYRSQEGWYETKVYTDLSLATPFQAIRNVHAQVDHSSKRNSGEEKVQLELNGTPLVNAEASYNTADKYEGSLTFSDPWPMEYSASASSKEGVSEASVYANWDRDDMNSNIKLASSYSDKSTDYKADRELDISVEQSSRKMGITSKMNGAGNNVISNGKIYWDSNEDSKVSYDLVMNDNSRGRKDLLDGSFKLGLPSRTLGVSGSFSDNKVVRSADATFSWDDRDNSKQVGVKTSMVRGDPIKGEVTLIMPAIRKEISVSGTIMAKSGRVIFDTTTDISYSSDSRKTLTLTSRLEDISDYSSNYNYSLALGLKHPHTDVDIQMNSHLGSSDEKFTVGMKGEYLTAKRQRKNMALLAEINTLKRLISLQADANNHQMEIVGDIVSTSPYKVRLVNRLDGQESFRSDLTVDSARKSLVANAILGEDAIALGAKYPSPTTFRADLTYLHDGISSQEALLALKLNSSRLLHTRLTWNPEMLEQLRAMVLAKVALGEASMQAEMDQFNQAVAEELTAKYQAIAESSLQELRPVLNMLQREMHQMSATIRELSASLREMYDRNDFYIQDMGVDVNDAYMALMERLVALNRDYISVYTRAIREMTRSMRQMTSYPMGQRYTDMVQEVEKWLDQTLEKSLKRFSDCLIELDAALKGYRDSLEEMSNSAVDTLYNNSYVDAISNRINTIGPYVKDIKMPEAYTNAIYSVRSSINNRMTDLMEIPEIAYVKGGVNEVYQQGVWAYNYWQVEENIHRHLMSIARTLADIARDEMKRNLEFNPVTVWLPNEVQMEIPLPVDVRRLDSVEDLEPLIDKLEKWLEKNMPDQTTWDKAVKSLSEIWEETEVEQPQDKLEQDLRTYKPSKPSRKLRKLKKGRRYRIKARRS